LLVTADDRTDDQTVPGASSPDWVVELQGVLLSTDSLDAFLDELATAAARAVPAAAACGVTLQPDGKARTVAASNALASQVDEIQYGVDDGPCLEAMRTGETIEVTDLGSEQRWPQFATAALAFEVRSVLSTPLRVDTTTVGALNLYATTAGAFDNGHRLTALRFAKYAAGAVGLALRLAEHVQMSADLRAALASRAIIDQAVGIVMVQQRCTADEAFAVLRRASQQRNIKIHAIAAGIIEGVTGRPPTAGRFTSRP